MFGIVGFCAVDNQLVGRCYGAVQHHGRLRNFDEGHEFREETQDHQKINENVIHSFGLVCFHRTPNLLGFWHYGSSLPNRWRNPAYLSCY
jgi:hypothetical protein